MKDTRAAPQDSSDTMPRMPGWITSARADAPEDVAFLSGAALSHLHLVAICLSLPHALWRERLALRAAEVCAGLAGRGERAPDLRDAVHLARPGDAPGPAGEIFRQWVRAVARPVSAAALHGALSGAERGQIAGWLAAGQGGGQGAPVARAAAVLEAVLADRPRDEAMALILADAALARALGWSHLVPLLAAGLGRHGLRRRGDALRLACYRGLVTAAGDAVREAADLTRRAGRLEAVAPKLRAKGAGEAVALFLARDALAPFALTAFMSDRAARRLCERLVGLGALRELTGRDSFRLYGV